MPCICYVPKTFRSDKLDLIYQINGVVEEYTRQGYTLTLRQLYYQLVARGIIENNMRSYKNTGNLINDARLAGLIDWTAIEDRTRSLKGLTHWSNPQEIIRSASCQYKKDLWKNQKYHLEVWVEKEALAEVVAKACRPFDVDYFCCRGYVSQSEMWSAAQRLVRETYCGKDCVIIHLGDHDPSGIDMSRDIEDRLQMFGNQDGGLTFENHFLGLRRIALNMDQIETFNPPPNPAKLTDSRCKSYMDKYGDESWELDALEPKVLNDLIQGTICEYADLDYMERVRSEVETEKEVMNSVCDDWDNLMEIYSR